MAYFDGVYFMQISIKFRRHIFIEDKKQLAVYSSNFNERYCKLQQYETIMLYSRITWNKVTYVLTVFIIRSICATFVFSCFLMLHDCIWYDCRNRFHIHSCFSSWYECHGEQQRKAPSQSASGTWNLPFRTWKTFNRYTAWLKTGWWDSKPSRKSFNMTSLSHRYLGFRQCAP